MAANITPIEQGDPSNVPAPTDVSAPEMPDEDEVLREFNARFRQSKDHHQQWRDEARSLYDLIAGKQWDAADSETMVEQGRPMVTFNLSGKYMDAISGLQVNNRQEIKYLPREQGDARTNEVLTSAVKWGRDLTDVEDDETDAFYDAVLQGYGWMQGYLDKDALAEGVPTGQRVDPLEMFPDPAARKRNLTDARYIIRVKFVDREEYEELTGNTTEDDNTLAELVAEEDDVLQVIHEPQDYRTNNQADSSKRSRRPVAEYEFWKREPRMAVQAKQYGQTLMEMHEWKVYESLLKRAKAEYTAQPVKVKTYYRARICNGAVQELKRSPYKDGFTFHAITGKRDRNAGTFYGIGRSLVDPQKWVNKFFSTILYSLMVGAKGGLLAEENSFTDPRKAESEWANPASITFVKEGALQKGKVTPKPAPAYPEGLERLMTFSMNAIPQVSGLNAELMGLAERVQAGVVEAQRKQSAMAIIAWAFDAMKRYYRSMGRQMAEYVRDYMSEGTLILVQGEAGRQYIPLVKNQLALKYDVIVDEAPTSVNMKERVWGTLETLIPQLLQAGLKIPQEILDYSPLPQDLVEKWKQVLKPDPKTQQIQEQQVMTALQKLTAEVAKTASEGKLNEAKVAEIMAELQKPAANPQAEQQMELFKAQVDAQVQSKIAEFKANREAETKLMIAEMNVKSEERIAAMQAQITATLEANKMDQEAQTERTRMDHEARMNESQARTDMQSRMAVAAIAKGKPDVEEEDVEPKEDPVALVAEAVGELKEAIKAMSEKKPRKLKIKRDKNGDMTEVEEG